MGKEKKKEEGASRQPGRRPHRLRPETSRRQYRYDDTKSPAANEVHERREKAEAQRRRQGKDGCCVM